MAKGPGGRPKKAAAERRTQQRKLNLTIAEEAFIEEQAKTAGVTLAEFARRRCLFRPVTAPPAQIDAKLLYELNAVGVNLMQMMRDERFERGHRSAQDWSELHNRLSQVIEKVGAAF